MAFVVYRTWLLAFLLIMSMKQDWLKNADEHDWELTLAAFSHCFMRI